MKYTFTKISLFILLAIVLASCNATKRVPKEDFLLTDNTITVDGEKITDQRFYNFLYQQPNTKVAGSPFRLYIYNWARPNIDSILAAQRAKNDVRRNFWTRLLSRKQVEAFRKFKKDFNSGVKKTGEPPTIVNEILTKKSANRLAKFYINNGYFNTEVDYSIKKDSNQRATVHYNVVRHQPYLLDSIVPIIASPVADSIYEAHKNASFLKKDDNYQKINLDRERLRIEKLFRNNGLYHFESDRIRVRVDSNETGHKANLEYFIDNRKETVGDSILDFPFKVHKVSEININTDYSFANKDKAYADSISADGYTFYVYDELNYRTNAITDIIPLKPGSIYRDIDKTQTLTRLSRLNTFKYPSISYQEDPKDSTGTNLIANIRLTPLEKYKFRADFDVSTSNIQDIGIAGFGSLLIRNIFKGAETLEISARGNIGASDDAANDSDSFFNISEIGLNANLVFPRIFFPVNTSKLIPAEWQPNTRFNLGVSIQQNIGLDKQSFAGGLSYNWTPSATNTFTFDLLDIQYVRNLNANNYFNIYRNSYDDLNTLAASNINNVNPDYFEDGNNSPELIIPNGADSFINDVENGIVPGFNDSQVSEINAIRERQNRLIEDNLIFALNLTYTYNNRENLYDDAFSRLRTRIELAGNALSLASNLINAPKNEDNNSRILGVVFSQYAKTEIDYTKHWDLGHENILAIRAFGGLAIPYGNANSIPFTRSFFAGGSNDNRAWRAYELGPGSSGAPNEFNEANMKLALNVEHRFELLGPFEGAFFLDAGNIWNVFDNVEDTNSQFRGFSSLSDLALGSGFGLRLDFDFFLVRFDVGFKTYDPAFETGNRWFREYNFANAVYNIGINYPF
ncbi:membrane protein [Dokdonia pacifica]|uniref:Outer membrane protein assembly factor BamA n=1 Tax=Dokdonia pacifica TaxID=1627892 RepID=A0A239C2V1_9FLAO|nr:BamA/TamA family outer membrane protein [Dokdonia pacifica]GGG26898.1 membrane protein [Dokdonia pacifica]SNS14249.1 Outer membrane protein assembly factor BamA [Dokdonia pacifica]